MISFIVSVLSRSESLNACLATLDLQSGEHQIIVCDNGPLGRPDSQNYKIAMRYDSDYEHTGLRCTSGYESANLVTANDWGERPCPTNEWLCFPSDDSLYVQGFSEIMLHEAERNPNAGLIHCDCLYKLGSLTGSWPAYTIMDSAAAAWAA